MDDEIEANDFHADGNDRRNSASHSNYSNQFNSTLQIDPQPIPIVTSIITSANRASLQLASLITRQKR